MEAVGARGAVFGGPAFVSAERMLDFSTGAWHMRQPTARVASSLRDSDLGPGFCGHGSPVGSGSAGVRCLTKPGGVRS